MYTDSTSLLKDLPVVLISFDERNLTASLEAARGFDFPLFCHSHGVHGFDAAHKAASSLAKKHSDSPWFVTIDGDNTIFHSHVWEARVFDILEEAGLLAKDSGVVSFRAINSVNRACYGNGGVKIWSHTFVDDMVTHEVSEGKPIIDFCWHPNYVQMANVLSYTNPNGSPWQALRAGYREGVKLAAGGYGPSSAVEMAHRDVGVFTRVALGHWTMLGLDVPNGAWLILGALAGLQAATRDPEAARDSVVSYTNTTSQLNDFIDVTFNVPSIDEVSAVSAASEIHRMSMDLVSTGVLSAVPLGADRSAVMRACLTEAQRALHYLPVSRLS